MLVYGLPVKSSLSTELTLAPAFKSIRQDSALPANLIQTKGLLVRNTNGNLLLQRSFEFANCGHH